MFYFCCKLIFVFVSVDVVYRCILVDTLMLCTPHEWINVAVVINLQTDVPSLYIAVLFLVFNLPFRNPTGGTVLQMIMFFTMW